MFAQGNLKPMRNRQISPPGHDTRAIQDWLGHRAIQHTARYTELSQERFKDFWRT
jgi:type 1 fimbriae regulatory protein FimB/type 1 fimbriae regulatory protein FimE